MVLTYLHFRILEISHWDQEKQWKSHLQLSPTPFFEGHTVIPVFDKWGKTMVKTHPIPMDFSWCSPPQVAFEVTVYRPYLALQMVATLGYFMVS